MKAALRKTWRNAKDRFDPGLQKVDPVTYRPNYDPHGLHRHHRNPHVYGFTQQKSVRTEGQELRRVQRNPMMTYTHHEPMFMSRFWRHL